MMSLDSKELGTFIYFFSYEKSGTEKGSCIAANLSKMILLSSKDFFHLHQAISIKMF